MGTLHYDGQCLRFDDSTLMHLMIATTARLRRNEPFLLCWHDGTPDMQSRKAVWLSASSILYWSLDGPDPAIDRERLERMIMAASSSVGLYVRAEAPVLTPA